MAVNTQKINVKSVLRYSFLPGIFPRAKAFSSSGFGYLAFLFACVYRAVRILPKNHPYVNQANIGSFGILQVIRAASNNVHMGWRNIDQIIVFLALLAAVGIMIVQFVLAILVLFTGKAFASGGGSGFTSMFQTPNPVNDIAFMLLDLIFGIPAGTGTGPNLGFFGSAAIPTGPTPFHEGLHALFNFYNLALLLVGVLIFMYYVVVVVIETAQTGVPFGARFSKLYAPIRLVIAVGLLIPLNYGFNGAQYVTLYAAKIGSSFATNGWILYNSTLLNPTGGDSSEMVGRPRGTAPDELLYFSSVYHACRDIYDIWVPKNLNNPSAGGREILPYVIVGSTAQALSGYDYGQAKTDFGKNDMEIVLGELDTVEHANYAGGVRPYCGKITVSLSNDNPPYYTNPTGGGMQSPNTGVRAVEYHYYQLVNILLDAGNSSFTPFVALGERMARTNVGGHPYGVSSYNPCHQSGVLGDDATCGRGVIAPGNAVFSQPIETIRTIIETAIDSAYSEFIGRLDLSLTQEIQDRGWGGAGIWYNHIADVNGAFTSAVYAMPSVKQFPEVMEFVKKEKLQQDQTNGICEMFEPNLSQGKLIDFQSAYDDEVAKALNGAYKYFACEKANHEVGTPAGSGGGGATAGCPTSASTAMSTGATGDGHESNPIISVMSLIFGINGLFELRSASCWDNTTGRPSINPLAQMSTLGRSLVENAIRSMGIAIGFSFGGGILGGINQSLGGGLMAASSMFVGIATIGLTAGFVLYYILPFLPFIYFFFAVGAWVKSIFEAMVGAPLWALAHLHIDGDGMPGRAAMGGYFLLFEIFLRPIIIVFGLIAGMSVFTAMAGILNNIFDLVVFNTSGAVPGASTSSVDSFRRGTIDQFFFTIMYAILLYMMGTASFKLIDSIPNGIMRWIGSGVSTFNDNKGDPAGGLTGYAAIGANQVISPVLGGVQQAAGSVGGLGGSLIKSMKGN